MNDEREAMAVALDRWAENLGALIRHLSDGDEDVAREDVLILLLQGLDLFGGPESMMMQQSFPVLDAIKKKIDASDLGGALRQVLYFRQQIEEVRDLVRTGGD